MHRIVWIVLVVVAAGCGDKKDKANPKAAGSAEAPKDKPKPEPEKLVGSGGRSLGDLTAGGSGKAPGPNERPANDVAPRPAIKPVAGDCNWKIEDVAQAAVCEYRCTLDEREACALAAVRYLKGDNVKADPKRALELATRACELESAYGCMLTGGLHEKNLDKVEEYANKMKPLFERDCKENDGPACLQVALLKVDEKEGRPIYRKGFDLLKTACDAGDGRQCALLATRYNDGGNGLPKDVVFAADLRKKACEHGHATTCFELSSETDKDDKRGALVEKACTLGLKKACAKIALELAGKNTTRMIEINKRACELGDGESCVRIGEDFVKLGNKDKAAETFAKACTLGSSAGCAHARTLGPR